MIGLEKPRLTAGRVKVPYPVPPPDAAASVGPPGRHVLRIHDVVSLEHERGVVEGLLEYPVWNGQGTVPGQRGQRKGRTQGGAGATKREYLLDDLMMAATLGLGPLQD